MLKIAYVLAILLVLFTVEQSNFYALLPLYGIAFATYIWTCFYNKNKDQSDLKQWLIIAVALRIIAVFTFPLLSDDIYRFVWDGQLIQQGIHPFASTPTEFLNQNGPVSPFLESLYQDMNSQDYHTIYPPIAQATFYIGGLIGGTSMVWNMIIMKLFILIFELGTLFYTLKILKLLKKESRLVLLYALNPLIVLEIMGNMHFEGAMVFFMVLSFYFLLKNEKYDLLKAALAFALAVASKLLPLMLLPLLFLRLGWKKAFQFYVVVGVSVLLLFAPMYSASFVNGFGESLNLYFQKFEFNASIYYIARWIGEQVVGYNLIHEIGPALSKISTLLIVLWAFVKRKPTLEDLPNYIIYAFTTYLLFATTIHPWYLSLLIIFSVFSKGIRYPIFWSGLIMLTYINYSYGDYFENLQVVIVEYVLVFGMIIYDYFKRRQLAKVL